MQAGRERNMRDVLSSEVTRGLVCVSDDQLSVGSNCGQTFLPAPFHHTPAKKDT